MQEHVKEVMKLMKVYKEKYGFSSDRAVVERYCLDALGKHNPAAVDALLELYNKVTGSGLSRGRQEKFSDRMDASYQISLYEYGLIRNPKTDKVIYCLNVVDDVGCMKIKPIIKTMQISFEEVQECLADMPDCYFQFIGSDRQTEVAKLDNEYLTHIISSADQYNGYFIEGLY